MKYLSITLAAALMSFAPSISAMTATQKVEKEITKTNADGSVTTERVPAELVTPGEKVVYTLDIVNTEAQAATDLVLAMPVPKDVKYIEGTAERAGTIVKYSADGGTTFTDRDALLVKTVAGERTASSEDITHIQWKIAGPINAGSADSVAFKARLK